MRPLRLPFAIAVGLLTLLVAAPAWACGGLVNSNGTVTLVRTTTMAAYHAGIEHYVTSFEFAGGEGEFGSIIPLPGVPTKVIRGGDWTLQRLVQETQPQPEALALAATGAGAAEDRAKVILKTEIDALDIVVLEGGGTAVGDWAREHGFFLPPDAPEVLDFYAERSPIFMAVRFDASRAAEQGLGAGDGTPVHVVIPTTNPWVPLRILGLGAAADAPVEADVYLLTDLEPATLPGAADARGSRRRCPQGVRPGLVLERSEPASPSLLDRPADRQGHGLAALGRHVALLPPRRRPCRRSRLRPRDRRERRRPAVARGRGPGPRGGGRSDRHALVRTGAVDRDRRARSCSGVVGSARATSPDRTPRGLRLDDAAMVCWRSSLVALGRVRAGVRVAVRADRARSGSTTRRSRSTRSTSSRARRCGSSSRTRTRSTTSSSSGTRPCRSRTSSGPRRSTRRGRGRSRSRRARRSSTTFTFGERDLLFGCHLPGHYVYGMRGTIEVA